MKKQMGLLLIVFILFVAFSFTSSHVQTYKLYPILDPIDRPFTHPIGSPEADAQLQDAYSILKEERGER